MTTHAAQLMMPIDKTKSATRLRIHPELLADPKRYILERELPARSSKPSAKGTVAIDLLTYGGIKLEVARGDGDGLSDVTVHFNPGKVLFGHNGRMLTSEQFLDALSLYITHGKKLLAADADWRDLVPGLRDQSPARWLYVEMPRQWRDPDGLVLAAHRHLRHPSIRTKSRHWRTSMDAGGKRSQLQLSIYNKAEEMIARGKFKKARVHALPDDYYKELEQYMDVLRLEVRLKGDKLVHYLGNDQNVEIIDGNRHLVRFRPGDIQSAPHTVFGELLNVWQIDELSPALGGQLAPIGRLLAEVANDARTCMSLPELLDLVKYYCRPDPNGDTMTNIRDAAAHEISRRSELRLGSLFGDTAHAFQPSIVLEHIEKKVSYPIEEFHREPLLVAAYQHPNYIAPWPQNYPSYMR